MIKSITVMAVPGAIDNSAATSDLQINVGSFVFGKNRAYS